VLLHLRSTEAERALWNEEAAAAGIGVSTWVKTVVNKHIRDERARRARLEGK